VATQGRSFWILDNITSLHQIGTKTTASETRLLAPRDGYRTRVAPGVLGPNIEYFLPAAPAGVVTMEILDEKGVLANSYNSETPFPGGGLRGGRGGAGGAGGGAPETQDPDAAPMGRGRGGPAPRVTKNAGLNRFVWDARNQAGVAMPPGSYQARLKAGDVALTQPFKVLIDPRVAEDGVTAADLREQYTHNMRMRALVTSVNQVVARVRDAQSKLRGATGADAEKAKAIDAVAGRLLTEPVRYGKPGLQAHITYLAGMTSGADQKIGQDAVERYGVLEKELAAIKAQVDTLLGPAR
jgi:hypothetical protein